MEEFIRRWNDRRTVAVDPATRQAFLANDPAALAAYFRAGEELPGLDPRVVRQVQLPVLLIAGSEDHPRAEESRQAAALLPNGHFAGTPRLDHASCLSAQADVTALLTGFLERIHADCGLSGFLGTVPPPTSEAEALPGPRPARRRLG